jgi:hypothetical protein
MENSQPVDVHVPRMPHANPSKTCPLMLRIDFHVNGVAIDSVGLPGAGDHAAFFHDPSLKHGVTD